MESTTGYGTAGYDALGSDLGPWADLLPAKNLNRDKRLQNRSEKKRHRPLRKNRKPSRPANHIGQRTNNRLLRVCNAEIQLPEAEE